MPVTLPVPALSRANVVLRAVPRSSAAKCSVHGSFTHGSTFVSPLSQHPLMEASLDQVYPARFRAKIYWADFSNVQLCTFLL